MALLILKEKHGYRYFSFGSQQELELLAGHIVCERNDECGYEDTKSVNLILALEGNNKAALKFLQSRQDWEYESFEIVEPGTVDSFKGDTL